MKKRFFIFAVCIFALAATTISCRKNTPETELGQAGSVKTDYAFTQEVTVTDLSGKNSATYVVSANKPELLQRYFDEYRLTITVDTITIAEPANHKVTGEVADQTLMPEDADNTVRVRLAKAVLKKGTTGIWLSTQKQSTIESRAYDFKIDHWDDFTIWEDYGKITVNEVTSPDKTPSVRYDWETRYRLWSGWFWKDGGTLNPNQSSEMYYWGRNIGIIVRSNFRNYNLFQKTNASSAWVKIY
jgi:hypothetical protein